MAKLMTTLKRAATTAAKYRGHDMGKWVALDEITAERTCRKCGMNVHVNIRPLPNEIDIGGRAVALNCR